MTFQCYINEVLFDFLDECCMIYIDDILIYSTNIEEYEGYIKIILDRFHKIDLYIDIKKNEFFIICMKFSDFIINIEGIAVDSEKIDVIHQ